MFEGVWPAQFILKRGSRNEALWFAVQISHKDLDTCYWLKHKERAIVKFCKKKHCQKVIRIKSDLRKANMAEIDLPVESCIFVNQSLCSYYRLL